ncbi:hypothetical protein Gocc_2903 [Gaiella occulta]|uniref:Uncharacterized protein n=1 Tax=Gaiella occulta TaxID=1002870 RepID=A0A7M2YT12_9ACTN|nr:hypothetical protein [Gaiella occulta]RDI73303.1 hypothetical protein Gocc_2903 [Gaiella occulta]
MAGEIAFVAPLLRAAIATLKAGLPARIAAFNAQTENTVALAAPDVSAYHFGGNDVLSAAGFPQIEVAAPQGSFGAWTIGRTEVDHDPVVNVVVWQEALHGQIPPAYEAALGYVRCVIEALRSPGAFGGQVEIAQDNGVFWRIDVLPDDMTSDGREFRKWRVPALITFRLETVEKFGS